MKFCGLYIFTLYVHANESGCWYGSYSVNRIEDKSMPTTRPNGGWIILYCDVKLVDTSLSLRSLDFMRATKAILSRDLGVEMLPAG